MEEYRNFRNRNRALQISRGKNFRLNLKFHSLTVLTAARLNKYDLE